MSDDACPPLILQQGTHDAVLTSADYLSQAQRQLGNVEVGAFPQTLPAFTSPSTH